MDEILDEQSASVGKCAIAVTWQRAPGIRAVRSIPRKAHVVSRAIVVVHEKINEPHREQLALVETMNTTRLDILQKLLGALDLPRIRESRLVVVVFLRAQLDRAEHSGEILSEFAEPRIVRHHVKPRVHMKDSARIEKSGNEQRTRGKKRAHLILDDVPEKAVLNRLGHGLADGILVHRPEQNLAAIIRRKSKSLRLMSPAALRNLQSPRVGSDVEDRNRDPGGPEIPPSFAEELLPHRACLVLLAGNDAHDVLPRGREQRYCCQEHEARSCLPDLSIHSWGLWCQKCSTAESGVAGTGPLRRDYDYAAGGHHAE